MWYAESGTESLPLPVFYKGVMRLWQGKRIEPKERPWKRHTAGSISSQGTAEGLANQPRGKGQGKAGTGVEAQQGKAKIEKA